MSNEGDYLLRREKNIHVLNAHKKYIDYLSSLDLSLNNSNEISVDVYKKINPIIKVLYAIKAGVLNDEQEKINEFQEKLISDIKNIDMNEEDKKKVQEIINNIMNMSQEDAKEVLSVYGYQDDEMHDLKSVVK